MDDVSLSRALVSAELTDKSVLEQTKKYFMHNGNVRDRWAKFYFLQTADLKENTILLRHRESLVICQPIPDVPAFN